MLYSEIKTEYPEDGDPSTSFKVAHPIWRPHLLQRWATDFIPNSYYYYQYLPNDDVGEEEEE
jgi:hypothetical protein